MTIFATIDYSRIRLALDYPPTSAMPGGIIPSACKTLETNDARFSTTIVQETIAFLDQMDAINTLIDTAQSSASSYYSNVSISGEYSASTPSAVNALTGLLQKRAYLLQKIKLNLQLETRGYIGSLRRS